MCLTSVSLAFVSLPPSLSLYIFFTLITLNLLHSDSLKPLYLMTRALLVPKCSLGLLGVLSDVFFSFFNPILNLSVSLSTLCDLTVTVRRLSLQVAFDPLCLLHLPIDSQPFLLGDSFPRIRICNLYSIVPRVTEVRAESS